MNFQYEHIKDIIGYISFFSTIIAIAYPITKILNRTKIDYLLEDRHRRKLNDFIELVIISLIISVTITFGISSIPSNENIKILVGEGIIWVIFINIILIISIFILKSLVLKKGREGSDSKILCVIKYSSILIYVGLIYINAAVIYIISFNTDQNVLVSFTISFIIFYVVYFIILRKLNVKLYMKQREFYTMRVIDCLWQNKSAELCNRKMQSPALYLIEV
ncbi:hypothetical protein [Ornithinibacillus contaminans]|uniref:hypothetical protein n=1 Tax=Ornithinibacillus contaminans TaxID=694055 RepID=UPI00064DFAC0|nr:hypothetical protein [Ornithinibacillus contaminans]